MPPALHIERFTLGMWQTNCYLLTVGPVDRPGRPAWIIDAGFDPQPILDAIHRRNLDVRRILLTHAHIDHIAGLDDLRQALPDVPIAIHSLEADFLTDPDLNLSGPFGLPLTAPPADQLLADGDDLELDGLAFRVLHTPGHSPGGVTFHQGDTAHAFVGDTLFLDSIGRFDFPTSDGPALFRSIRTRLLALPDETTVWPGHGPQTTIGRERAHNPYLKMQGRFAE